MLCTCCALEFHRTLINMSIWSTTFRMQHTISLYLSLSLSSLACLLSLSSLASQNQSRPSSFVFQIPFVPNTLRLSSSQLSRSSPLLSSSTPQSVRLLGAGPFLVSLSLVIIDGAHVRCRDAPAGRPKSVRKKSAQQLACQRARAREERALTHSAQPSQHSEHMPSKIWQTQGSRSTPVGRGR